MTDSNTPGAGNQASPSTVVPNAPVKDKSVQELAAKLLTVKGESNLEEKYLALDTLNYEVTAAKEFCDSSVKVMNRGITGFFYGVFASFLAAVAISKGDPVLGETVLNGTILTGAGGLGVRVFTDNAIDAYTEQQAKKKAEFEILSADIQQQMSEIPETLPLVAEVKYTNLLQQDLKLSAQLKHYDDVAEVKEYGLKVAQLTTGIGAFVSACWGIAGFMGAASLAVGMGPVLLGLGACMGLGYITNNFFPDKISAQIQKNTEGRKALETSQAEVQKDMTRIAAAFPVMARAVVSAACEKAQDKLSYVYENKDIGEMYFDLKKLQKKIGNIVSAKENARTALGIVSKILPFLPFGMKKREQELVSLSSIEKEIYESLRTITTQVKSETLLESKRFTDLMKTPDGSAFQKRLKTDFSAINKRMEAAEREIRIDKWEEAMAAKKEAEDAAKAAAGGAPAKKPEAGSATHPHS